MPSKPLATAVMLCDAAAAGGAERDLAGRPLIERSLDRLAAAGIDRIVLCGDGAAIADRIAARGMAVETGATLHAALADGDVLVVRADICWLDGYRPLLDRLARQWDPQAMDALLALHPTVFVDGRHDPGEYDIDALGLAKRRQEGPLVPFVFAGIAIVSPRLVAGAPADAGLGTLFDRAEEAERLYGVRHDGVWFRVADALSAAAATAWLTRGGPRETLF